MPYSIELTPEYVQVKWFGEVGNSDLEGLAKDMPAFGRQLGKVPDVLHLFTASTVIRLDFDTMHAHGRGLGRIPLTNKSRTACVCEQAHSFGMARMMQSLNANPNIEMEVFDTLDSALAWMRSPMPE